jgi:uncharacterized protein (TIGR01777 family)
MTRVLVTGATGFLGRAIAARFLSAGWSVAALSRNPGAARAKLPGAVEVFPWDNLPRTLDAVVHLAGESIAGGLWTRARKRRLLDSRVAVTRKLITALSLLESPPAVFVSASGMGYYGDRGDDAVRLGDPPGQDFLGRMAAAWERESLGAETFGARAVVIRLGMVLGPGGGALPAMTLPFRLGLGVVLGSGQQYWPWIHRDDAADLFFRAVKDPAMRGSVLGAVGVPVTQREFAKALAGVLRRPLFLRIPEPVIRLGLGEMADLFLLGQRVEPDARFPFRHGELAEALRAILRGARGSQIRRPN